MMATVAYVIALIASMLWFSVAFRYFSFQQTAAAKVLVPDSARTSPLFPTIVGAVRFLGGMNGAFALLATILLLLFVTESEYFRSPVERGVLLLVFSAAHLSQFVFNLPILMNGQRQGESYWPVLSGPMLFIFVIDAIETVINLLAGIIQFAAA